MHESPTSCLMLLCCEVTVLKALIILANFFFISFQTAVTRYSFKSICNLFTFIAQQSALLSQFLGTDETTSAMTWSSEARPRVSCHLQRSGQLFGACGLCGRGDGGGLAHLHLPAPHAVRPTSAAPLCSHPCLLRTLLPAPADSQAAPRSSPGVGNGEKRPFQAELRQTVLLPTTDEP